MAETPRVTKAPPRVPDPGVRYPHPLVSCLMPIIAVLALAVAVMFAFIFWQWSLPGVTDVPSVEGKTRAEAVTALVNAHLVPDVVEHPQPSETYPEGTVLSTMPIAGQRVREGRHVRVLLSAGSVYTTVPDVRETSQADAEAKLDDAGLTITDEQYQYHDAIPYDGVISISPDPGTKLKRGSGVSLVISDGQQQNYSAESDVRSTIVHIMLPSEGESDQEVKVNVQDADGNRTVYQEKHHPGDELITTVQSTGKTTIQVFWGDRLLQTRKLL